MWVVDTVTGCLYGHIVAGIPEAGIAYIIPAYMTFQDIEERMGAPVELVSKFSDGMQPVFELPTIEPVGSELNTPTEQTTNQTTEEWPLPLSPLGLLFTMAELRDIRAGNAEIPNHEVFYNP